MACYILCQYLYLFYKMPADMLDNKTRQAGYTSNITNASEFLENGTSRLSSEIESLKTRKASPVEMHKTSGVGNWENEAEIQDI